MDFSFRAIDEVIHPTAAFNDILDLGDEIVVDDVDGNYGQGEEFDEEENAKGGPVDSSDWSVSQLNPRNRIDSLTPPAKPLWRIDGAAGFGTQFFAYPLFIKKALPPMHLDVFIEEQTRYPPVLRDLLDMGIAAHTKDATRLRRLGIAQHILRILQWHTTNPSGVFYGTTKRRGAVYATNSPLEQLYTESPYATRFVLKNLCCHVHKVRIDVNNNYTLESDLVTYKALKEAWGLAADSDTVVGKDGVTRDLPPEVNILNVRLLRQLHDSTSLVTVYPHPVSSIDVDDEDPDGVGKKAPKSKHGKKNKKGKKPKRATRDKNEIAENGTESGEATGIDDYGDIDTGIWEPEIVILKSLSSDVKYLYQELCSLLLEIPPHDGVLSRPLHIISKRCSFGNKPGVIGFTMPYYEAGSLRDILPLLRIHGQLTYAVQLRWARQITEAMHHLWQHSFYYPDLRLDNVVLTAPGTEGNAGLVDFEQRGVWSGFSAPEVDVFESHRIVTASNDNLEPNDYTHECRCRLAGGKEVALEMEEHHRFVREGRANDPQLKQLDKTRQKRVADMFSRISDPRYRRPEDGFNLPFNILTPSEKEAAMVYMLGRLLWCIFEGMSAPHRGAVWMSYPREPEFEFPGYRLTPPTMRTLIFLMCRGNATIAQPTMFVRQKSKWYIKEHLGTRTEEGEDRYNLVCDDIKLRARNYWRQRLELDIEFMGKRHTWMKGQIYGDGADGYHATANTVLEVVDDGPKIRNPDGTPMKTSMFGRPTLLQVLEWLKDAEKKLEGEDMKKDLEKDLEKEP